MDAQKWRPRRVICQFGFLPGSIPMKVCKRKGNGYPVTYIQRYTWLCCEESFFTKLSFLSQAKLVKYRDEAVEAEELVNHLTQQVKVHY